MLRCCGGHFLGLHGPSSSLLPSLNSSQSPPPAALSSGQLSAWPWRAVETRGHKRFSKRRWESGGREGQPCSCLRPQPSAAQANCRLRGPIPQSTPEQEGAGQHRPDGTQTHRNPQGAAMRFNPQNVPVQPQKPQNRPRPHSQINTNMQSRRILQKGNIQTHTKTRHPVTERPELTQSLSHSETAPHRTATHTKGQTSRGMPSGKQSQTFTRAPRGGGVSVTASGGHNSQETGPTVTHRLTYTARHTGKGPGPAPGPQISEPAPPTVTN